VEFRVIWEIEIKADSPMEAAKEARVIQLTPGMSATIFDVWAHTAGKMHRIDLIDEPDRLDRDELFAVRAGLRLLQCKADTPPEYPRCRNGDAHLPGSRQHAIQEGLSRTLIRCQCAGNEINGYRLQALSSVRWTGVKKNLILLCAFVSYRPRSLMDSEHSPFDNFVLH
jgi:hypothetical protein